MCIQICVCACECAIDIIQIKVLNGEFCVNDIYSIIIIFVSLMLNIYLGTFSFHHI